jgi:hypothetical protein
MARGHISPELRLAIDCCRCCFRGGDDVEPLLSAGIDWSKFLALIAFHRIEGLAGRALTAAETVPETVRHTLRIRASKIAAANLQSKSESHRLLHDFQAAGTDLLFLKGLPLGALAYENPMLKTGIDIDLLVDPTDLAKAAQSLRRAGYRLSAPNESAEDRLLHRWHRAWKESVWVKDSPPLQIDLHTRVADNRRLIPHIDVHSPRQWVGIGDDIRLPTLAHDELFAYLAVHGASSAWFRLKWIADFAALLHACSAQEIERLYDRSQELGAGRAAGQALLLADCLFGTLRHNQALAERLRSDSGTNLLFRAAFRMLLGGPVEPTDRRLGTFLIHWTQLLLLPGARFAASELARQARRTVLRSRL